MRTLLIDNHDSFTYNLFALLADVNGTEPLVVANDETSWDVLARERFDNVVVSPGPGRPQRSRDLGLSGDAVRSRRHPLLGVCLGHQALGHAFRASVGRAPEPMHGRLSKVRHDGDPLFAGLPSRFTVVRYHSLHVTDLPDDLQAIAWSDDGVLMALRHRQRPLWGVQFHPESICSEGGLEILDNFRALTEGWNRGGRGRAGTAWRVDGLPARRRPQEREVERSSSLAVRTRKVTDAPEAERVFVALFGDAPAAFWLDSAGAGGSRCRFSYMGDASGPLSEILHYDVGRRRLTVQAGARTTVRTEGVLDHLDRQLARRRLQRPDLPFGLTAGYVGYLGYELKADCGATPGPPATTPDAALIFADRVLAFDHAHRSVTLCALVEPGQEATADAWLEATCARIRELAHAPEGPAAPLLPADQPGPVVFRHDRDAYLERVQRCLDEIAEGESYELCLTTSATAVAPDIDPLALYRILRRTNPAPYSAFLRLPDVAVLSSSPERFLAIEDGVVETRPIKGTRRRALDPDEDMAVRKELANSEKDIAENLMIVDLARNDLTRACESGSVHVPDLFTVETYETVHQLVSTVRGRLRSDATAVDAVRAAFPPGSMAGAPKRRSMEILDRLEGAARGPYAGALGYFGLDGAVDLSVVIRALVMAQGHVSFGVGGAVVSQSDPAAEWQEVLVKAEPLQRALWWGCDDVSD